MKYYQTTDKGIFKLVASPDLETSFTVYSEMGMATIYPDERYPEGESLEEKKMNYRSELINIQCRYREITKELFEEILKRKQKYFPK